MKELFMFLIDWHIGQHSSLTHQGQFSLDSQEVNVVEDGKLHHTADEYMAAHLTWFQK